MEYGRDRELEFFYGRESATFLRVNREFTKKSGVNRDLEVPWAGLTNDPFGMTQIPMPTIKVYVVMPPNVLSSLKLISVRKHLPLFQKQPKTTILGNSTTNSTTVRFLVNKIRQWGRVIFFSFRHFYT